MSGRVSDDALSEVIGFILIIGLLVVVMSLYITYVVPSEGRTNEIEQMDYIKQQFLDYKLNTDALWLNNQIGASITQALTMGTAGQTTTGMFAGFSLVSPIGSSGAVLVNPMERSERMHITAAGVTQNDPSIFTVVDAPIIDKISPGSLPTTGGSVTLTGSGFKEGSDEVEVYFKGSKLDGATVNENTISFTAPSQNEAGIIHIYVKKPLGVRSNEVSLLITDSGDNPVPRITGFEDPGYYIVGSSGSIEIYADNVATNPLVFVDNILLSSSDGLTIPNSILSIISDNATSVPVTIINPQPGGGSSSKELFILPNLVLFPEIWGIIPDHASEKDSNLPSGLIIYGAGFNDGTIGEKTEVWWGDDTDLTTPEKDPIDPSYVTVNSKNKITIQSGFFNGNGRFDESGTIPISVRGASSSDAIQYSRGTLPPTGSDFPTTEIPIEKFYIRFEDTGYVTSDYHIEKTLNELLNDYYGIQLYDAFNVITIKIKAIPKIISADYSVDNPELVDPEEAIYYVTYQTDLVLDLFQGSNKIMENFVIKTNIQQSIDGSEEIWFDLLNPAYGINEYIKTPFTFKVTLLNDSLNQFKSEYVLLANTIESGVAVDNALGALEYNSQNYYYRTQQDFIYQSGGVFVEQVDGSNPLVLPPISVTRNGGNLVVGISNIPVSGYDNVAGSSQVQISSSLDSIDTYGITTGLPNAKSVILHIDPTTESNRARWYNTIKAICENARSNGVPVAFSEKPKETYDNAWVRIEKDGSDNPPILNIRGRDHEDLTNYQNTQDIILDLKTPELSVALNPVGKAVSIR